MTTGSRAVSAAHPRSRSRVRVTARAAVLAIVVMVLAIGFVYPTRLYIEQRGHVSELEKQTAQLVGENQRLSAEIAKLKDPVYLEQLARKCLGMVAPGETAFVMPPKGEEPEPVSC